MAQGLPAPAELERLRRLFRFFSASQCRGRSLVYETLSEGITADDDLLGLMLAAPAEQRRPSLLFAAVNLLLASDRDAQLAGYYPIHGGRRAVDGQLIGAFADFCARHRDELLGLLRVRSTQTNEIRRCVALRLGLDHVHRRWPGPLALVEVGASAGLNLLFDHYGYQLSGERTVSTSPVVISCDVLGAAPDSPVLAGVPEITSRLGIDQKPIDLSDPGERAWLEAFIWPEQVDELATLRAAIELALSTPAANVVPGDASADTARILTELPGREPVVVFTASLLSYLTAEARMAFRDQLRAVGERRPVAWVFAEAPGLLATIGLDLPALDGPLSRRNSHYLIGTSRYGTDRHDQLLALADPYLRQLVLARNATDDFH